MPFNRDLIESGCALKTFDGDLSVLEQVIDFTVSKSPISPQNQAAAVAPVSSKINNIAACVPREKRHIKEVVYGDNLDELPSAPKTQAVCHFNYASKQVIESPVVASGFCFRHLVEDAQHALDITVTHSEISYQKNEAVAPVSNHLNTAEASAPRAKRHIKDVVYGDKMHEVPSTRTQAVHLVSKQMVEVPTVASGFCFRHLAEDTDATHSANYSPQIAVKALLSEVSHHTHWRSAIHGF